MSGWNPFGWKTGAELDAIVKAAEESVKDTAHPMTEKDKNRLKDYLGASEDVRYQESKDRVQQERENNRYDEIPYEDYD